MLSESANRIARATGLTGGWIGLALLGTVTSLPELASGISAVAVIGAPHLAVGNAHLLSAAFGVVMPGFVAISLLPAGRTPALLHLGPYCPVLLGLYLLALRSVFSHERAQQAHESSGAADADASTLGREARRFALAAAVVLAAGSRRRRWAGTAASSARCSWPW